MVEQVRVRGSCCCRGGRVDCGGHRLAVVVVRDIYI